MLGPLRGLPGFGGFGTGGHYGPASQWSGGSGREMDDLKKLVRHHLRLWDWLGLQALRAFKTDQASASQLVWNHRQHPGRFFGADTAADRLNGVNLVQRCPASPTTCMQVEQLSRDLGRQQAGFTIVTNPGGKG